MTKWTLKKPIIVEEYSTWLAESPDSAMSTCSSFKYDISQPEIAQTVALRKKCQELLHIADRPTLELAVKLLSGIQSIDFEEALVSTATTLPLVIGTCLPPSISETYIIDIDD